MVLRIFNSLLVFITRPYIYIQKHVLITFQSYVPTHFDEKTWYILFGFMTFLIFIIAYILCRCITLQNMNDDRIHQHIRSYSMQKQHRKVT